MVYAELFLKVDSECGNGDGTLTVDEFEKLLIICGHRLQEKILLAAKIRRAFNVYNVKTSGAVTGKELPAIMSSAGHPLSEVQIQELQGGEENLDLEKALSVYVPNNNLRN
ncbi:uncharacterized protein [Haliotis cracherodii]|uniref:uncharacterized protein n=1 Tax=Haliotis cracherodii TaxID=6455 RepID=UPI0039EBE398